MHVLVLALWLGAQGMWGADKGMLLLERPGWQVEEAALIQGLRIYTQDLDVPFRTGALPVHAQSLVEQADAAFAACNTRAGVVLWFGGEHGAASLLALHCVSRELRDTPLNPSDELDFAAQTLALKVRWLLTKAPARDREVWRPVVVSGPSGQSFGPPTSTVVAVPPATSTSTVVAVPPATSTPTLPDTPAGASNSAKPGESRPSVRLATEQSIVTSIGPDVAVSARARRPAAQPNPVHSVISGPEIVLGYGIDTSTDMAWLRSSLDVRLTWPILRDTWAIEVDGSWGTRDSAQSQTNRATLSDYPVGIALLPRLRGSRWLLGLGPRASLHCLSVHGTSADGRSGSNLNLTPGTGGMAEAQVLLWRRFVLSLSLLAEYLEPHRQFTLDGQKAIDFGAFRWGGGAGLAFLFR